MFQRRNSHKPTLDLLTSFKESFPRIKQDSSGTQVFPATPAQTLTAACTEIAMTFNQAAQFSQFGDHDENYEPGFTPDNTIEWRQTDFFSNQSPGGLLFDQVATPFQQTPNSSSYYPHGQSSARMHQAPGGTMTPISRTASHSTPHPGHPNYMLSMQDYQLQPMPQMYNVDHYNHSYQPQSQPTHPMMGYDTGQGSVNPSRLDAPRADQFGSAFVSGENSLRFHVTLHTVTSMFKEGEHPVTYLNKCQPYKISIKDTRSDRQYWGGPTTYRTFIRVSFNEQQQRERPAPCWQLWKEGRGMSEAHHRGGRLQAVQFVPQTQSHHQSASVELEKEAFDGFSVIWTVPAGRSPECEVQMRCNFLSTDFSHSKGVKGIPVRLCAKTKVVDVGAMAPPSPPSTEICYCKVKLFRDHGAERKLSNDESHVRKSKQKLEEQIKQAQTEQEEALLTSSGKRRRSNSIGAPGRPSKIAKHRRGSSVSSNSSNDLRDPVEGDLHAKIASLDRQLKSKRDVSILYLKGDDSDDPDHHPVHLDGTSMEPLTTDSPQDRRVSRRSTQPTTVSGDGSPSTSVHSVNSPRRRQSNAQMPSPMNTLSNAPSNEWPSNMKVEVSTDVRSTNPQHLASPPDQRPTTEQRQKVKAGSETRTIDVLDVDPSYVPPQERKVAPIACFYVKTSMNGKPLTDPYYRAIYLYERSVEAFTKAIALKNSIAPNHVTETIRIRNQSQDQYKSDIQIRVDDEMISEMVEGQDLIAEFSPSDEADSSKPDPTTASYKLAVRF